MKAHIFSHNNPGDTVIIIDGRDIYCIFRSEDPDEPEELLTYTGTVFGLFCAASVYFATGEDAVSYEELSLPAQDAICNALKYLAKGGK